MDASILADSFAIHLDSPTASIERDNRQRNQINAVKTNELILNVPERINIKGFNGPATRFAAQDEFELRITLVEIYSERPVVLSATFRRIKDSQSANQPNRWRLVT